MIYNSLDIIPMKVYLQVEATGDINLLDPNDEFLDNPGALQLAWDSMVIAAKNYGQNKEDKRILKLSIKVEALNARNEPVALALHYLKEMPDDDLIEMLEGWGYKFRFKNTEGSKRKVRRAYFRDIERIRRESVAIEIRLENYRNKLPKIEDGEGEPTPFDQTVMSYCAFTEVGFINPNEITFTQHHALISNGNDKMKAIDEANAKAKRNFKKR